MIELSNDILLYIIQFFENGTELLSYMLLNKYIHNIVQYGEYECNIEFLCSIKSNNFCYNTIDCIKVPKFPKYIQIVSSYEYDISLDEWVKYIDKNNHIRKLIVYESYNYYTLITDCTIENLGKKFNKKKWNHITFYRRQRSCHNHGWNNIIYATDYQKFIKRQQAYIDNHIDDILYKSYQTISNNSNNTSFISINTNQRINLDISDHEYIRKIYGDCKIHNEGLETKEYETINYLYKQNKQNPLAKTLSHINFITRNRNISQRIINLFGNKNECRYHRDTVVLIIKIHDFIHNRIDINNTGGNPSGAYYYPYKNYYIKLINDSSNDVYWPTTQYDMKILYMIEYANKIFKTDCYDEEMTRFITFNPYKENNTYPIMDFIYGLDPKNQIGKC